MKKILALGFCFFVVFTAVYARGIAEDSSRIQSEADASYAMGMIVGGDFKQEGLKLNYGAFARGLRDIMEGEPTNITMDEALDLFREAYNEAMQKRTAQNKEDERLFFEENGQREGVITTESGLQYEIITDADGPKPGPADTVLANYRGTLLDGTVFDNSYERGEPVEFPLNAVIPGWAEGIQLMNVGSAYRLYIPSDLAYGEQGIRDVIPPSSVLVFDVELLEILEIDETGETDSPEYYFE